jgi:E3 ubiquitin-protein ligase MYCBP2
MFQAYYGGEARCDAEVGEEYDPTELVCGACSDVSRAQMCPKHGTDFLEYKCRYCCSVAVFFCFGTTHFCNACHDDFQRVTNIPRLELPSCPAGMFIVISSPCYPQFGMESLSQINVTLQNGRTSEPCHIILKSGLYFDTGE